MSATAQALRLLRDVGSPEAEVLRHLFETEGIHVAYTCEHCGLDRQVDAGDLTEDLAARYIVALAVSKGYDQSRACSSCGGSGQKLSQQRGLACEQCGGSGRVVQLDADLAAALEEARKRQS